MMLGQLAIHVEKLKLYPTSHHLLNKLFSGGKSINFLQYNIGITNDHNTGKNLNMLTFIKKD